MANAYEKTLLELCGSASRFKLLRALFESPNQSFHLRGLAAASRTDPGNAHRLMRRLVAAGLCERVPRGSQLEYRANRGNPLFEELVAMFSLASALVADLRRVAEAKVDGTVAIFGSFARGDDRPDSDIDILAITEESQILVQAHYMPVARKYRRDINVKAITQAALESEIRAGSGFWREVLAGPLLLLKGKPPNEIAGAVDEGEREDVSQGRAGLADDRELGGRKRRQGDQRRKAGPEARSTGR